MLIRFVVMEPNGWEPGVLREMLTEVMPGKGEHMLSMAEKWVADGFAKGVVQGRSQGRVESIREMITKRFGPLPDALQAEGHAREPEELDAWADALARRQDA